ncbi:MAG: CPBP family glutamic-type intramembrane protease [Myxococcota bacterium]
MTERRAFGWVAGGTLAVWAVHNAWLGPIEARAGVPEPLLLALRAVVWLGPALGYLRRCDPRPLGEALAVTTRPSPGGTAAALALGAAWVATIGAATGAAPQLHDVGWRLVGVLLEELLMRGFLFGQLARWIRGRAALATAALFAAMHVPGWLADGLAPEALVPSVVVVGILGLVLGFGRHWSRSIWPGVLVHLANNLLG